MSGLTFMLLGAGIVITVFLLARGMAAKPAVPSPPPTAVAGRTAPMSLLFAPVAGQAPPPAATFPPTEAPPPEPVPQEMMPANYGPPPTEPALPVTLPPELLQGTDLMAGLRDACDQGMADACFALAEAHRLGQGMAADMERAAPLYEKACDHGKPAGCAHIGYMYLTGKGVREDHARAAGFLKQGCDGGNHWACNLLRQMTQHREPIRRR